MKKVIFLDFDGVLNSEMDYILQIEYNKIPLNEVEDISVRAVSLLNTLIKDTGSDVVVSSTWRNNKTIEELQFLLEKYGFIGKIIGKTPHLGKGRIRGNEILVWIQDNIEYSDQYDTDKFRYVILDDDSDMLLWQQYNYIHCDRYIGLTPNVIYKATNILGRKKESDVSEIVCPECDGTGKEICNNPDHGLIDAVGTVRLLDHANGCPCCGNDELHRIPNTICNTCKGTGIIIQ